MNRHTIKRIALAFGLFACVSSAAFSAKSKPKPKPAAPKNEIVTFTFNPPNGMKWIEKTSNTRKVDSDNPDIEKSESVYTQRRKYEIKKNTTGYTVTSNIIDTTTKSDSRLFSYFITPLYKELMERCILTYTLDPLGKCTNLVGYDIFLQNAFQDGTITNTDQSTVNSLVEFIKSCTVSDWNAWNQKYAVYSGASVKIGSNFHQTEKEPVLTNFDVKFVEWVKRNGHNCVHIRSTFSVDPDALLAYSSTNPKVLLGEYTLQGTPRILYASQTGKADIILDPSTMMFYSVTNKSVIKTRFEVAGFGESNVSISDSSSVSFKYLP